MTYQIADAKTRYFNDKDHYIRFLKAWKRATNSVNCKATKNKYYGNKESGWLTGAHMFLYALLRGKDVYSAFTPITKTTKLQNGFYLNHGMYWAYSDLRRICELASQQDRDYAKRRVEEFLAPFNGTIDVERLVQLAQDLPQLSPIYSDYGPGKEIARQIIEGEIAEDQIWATIEEEA